MMKPINTPTTSSVWVSHPSHGFLKGTISDLQSSTLTVQLIDTKARNLKDVTVPYDSVFPAEENDPGHQDNCSLMYLNEATLLNNVKVRWEKGDIYVRHNFKT
jgi:myosin-6